MGRGARQPVWHLARRAESRIASGRDVVLRDDWQGALQIKRLFPNATPIFILPPSWDELEMRLNRRGEDPPGDCAAFFGERAPQVAQARHFDFVIINAFVRDGALRPEGDRPLRSGSSTLHSAEADLAVFAALDLGLIGDTPHGAATEQQFMARITAEDRLVKIPNRFQLVLAATYRARMLSQACAQDREQRTSLA